MSEAFLRDPLTERPAEPVFYAPSLDYYVVTRYADVERVFLDPETFSAANAQLPLVALEVGKTLLDADHVQLYGRPGGRLAAPEGVVRDPGEPDLGAPDPGQDMTPVSQV